MFHTVLFDVIGTTVKEKHNDTVMDCLDRAFAAHCGPVDETIVKKNRGRNKTVLIREVLNHHNYAAELTDPIYRSFERYFEESLSDFTENDGCAEIFSFLGSKGIKIGVGTGLSENLLYKVMRHLKWNRDQFDYIGSAENFANGRPAPDMILDMMQKLNLSDSKHFLKIGDTVADIQEGKNANVATAVLLSGSQPETVLLKESPDYVLKALGEIKSII